MAKQREQHRVHRQGPKLRQPQQPQQPQQPHPEAAAAVDATDPRVREAARSAIRVALTDAGICEHRAVIACIAAKGGRQKQGQGGDSSREAAAEYGRALQTLDEAYSLALRGNVGGPEGSDAPMS
jgi:hypothetical protein